MLRDGGRNPYANDGGQTKKWEWVTDTLDQWKNKRDQFERGDVIAYENRPEYLYVAGDCTKAYVPSKLALWIRQIVFVRPHTFVIFDRVVSTRPDYGKTWLLHCRHEPEIDGNTAVITNREGRLTVQTLLPEQPVIRQVEGYTYRGQTFDPPKTILSSVAERWRMEVLPSVAQTEDLFLHVLTTDEPQPARVVQNGERIGARVGEVEVLFDGRVGGTITIFGQQFPLKAEVKTGPYE
jgi:heparin/heparan-sulfate lyase